MIAGIITLAGTIVSLFFWLIKQRAARLSNPLDQNSARYAQIDKDIASHDSLTASLHGAADLDELARLQNTGSHTG